MIIYFYSLTYQVFCVPWLFQGWYVPWSFQGWRYSLLHSISKLLQYKFTLLTSQIIHTLEISWYASVCSKCWNYRLNEAFVNETNLILYKNKNENSCNAEKRRAKQGISSTFECGHPVNVNVFIGVCLSTGGGGLHRGGARGGGCA